MGTEIWNNSDCHKLDKKKSVFISPKLSFRHEILTMDGYHPNYNKENQDYSCFHSFASNKETTRIYVLADGHGPFGQFASKNCAEHIVFLLESWIKETLEHELSEEKIKGYLIESFVKSHEHIQKTDKEGDTYKYSGTTMVVALIRKGIFFLANLGDSRGFIASQIGTKLVPSLVSKDHKPDDPEERKRVTEAGGVVAPYREQDGSFNGPHRVWNKEETEPGLATSRSLGDVLGHRLGVISIPGRSQVTNRCIRKETRLSR